ncbi:cysteine-rich CWC family protein [Ectopseudomonas mendocina]|uniref:Cysteine-rich CWC family protein n=1 Tax=Ectopseudomonas mendocina TaxID=300 RepID=A0ABZ2RC79_ECTME
MSKQPNNPAICPSCGKSNQCAQAGAEAPVSHCWCFDVTIDRQHLPVQTGDSVDLSCLCPACARGHKAADSDSQ